MKPNGVRSGDIKYLWGGVTSYCSRIVLAVTSENYESILLTAPIA